MAGKRQLLAMTGSLLALVLLAIVYVATREDPARAAAQQQLRDFAAIPVDTPVTPASASTALARVLPVGSKAQEVLAYVAQKRGSCYWNGDTQRELNCALVSEATKRRSGYYVIRFLFGNEMLQSIDIYLDVPSL